MFWEGPLLLHGMPFCEKSKMSQSDDPYSKGRAWRDVVYWYTFLIFFFFLTIQALWGFGWEMMQANSNSDIGDPGNSSEGVTQSKTFNNFYWHWRGVGGEGCGEVLSKYFCKSLVWSSAEKWEFHMCCDTVSVRAGEGTLQRVEMVLGAVRQAIRESSQSQRGPLLLWVLSTSQCNAKSVHLYRSKCL